MRQSLLLGLTLVLLLFGLGPRADEGAGEEDELVSLEIEIALESPSGEPVEGVLSWRVGEASGSMDLKLPGSATLRLPPQALGRVEVEAPGYWAPPQPVVAGTGDKPKTLRMLEAGTVLGVVVAPEGEELPPEIDLKLELAGDGSKNARSLEPITQPCKVAEDGQWSCQVPAALLDFRLRVAGYVSHYRWNQRVPARGELDLGRFQLVPGSSVVGEVYDEAGAPPARATAFLEPLAATRSRSAESRARLDRQRLSAEVDSRGFFHIQGARPGQYRLWVEQEGMASASFSPVPVVEGRETSLPYPLTLLPPLRFEMVVEPPVDPYGKPWTAILHASKGDERREGPTDPAGLWQAEGLAPGDYRLSLETGTGEHREAWWSESLELEPEMPLHVVTLDIVEIAGTVTLGDDPLEADLRFGEGRGRKILVSSSEEGEFWGFLPRPGTWPVTIDAPGMGGLSLEPVEVEPPADGGPAELEIQIWDTRITGRVIDDQGLPVEAAQVSVHLMERHGLGGSAQSDEDGLFELRGLPPGAAVAYAQAPRANSATVSLEIRDGEETSDVELVVYELQSLEGQVLAADGPVRGVQLSSVPRTPLGTGAVSTQPYLLTDTDGRYELLIPKLAAAVDLLLLPPGHAARIQRVPLPAQGPVVTTLETAAGTLELRARGQELGPGALAAVLHFGGSQIPVGLLAGWAQYHQVPVSPEQMTLPQMAVGDYTLCLPRFGTAGNPPAGPTQCVAGTLAPGGRLELVLALDE